jgi:hypothetical protein
MPTVDFLQNTKDLRVAVLGSLGFSTDYIMRATGFSFSQVIYRLSKSGIRRAEYRDGHSPVAGIVLRVVERKAAIKVGKQLGHKRGKHVGRTGKQAIDRRNQG